MENQTELKWFQKPTGIIILLIVFFPVGLFLMWKNEMWSKKTRWIVTGAIAILFIANAGGSGSADKPKACDCVALIYEGPQMNWYGKDDTDDKMMADTWGWSMEKFDKWKKCRDAYPGKSSVDLDCAKENYKTSH